MIHMKFSIFACNKCLACLKIQAYSCCIQESISRLCDKNKSVSEDAKENFIFALFLRCAYNECMMVRLYLCLCLFAFKRLDEFRCYLVLESVLKVVFQV
jgi:hypothetical protein